MEPRKSPSWRASRRTPRCSRRWACSGSDGTGRSGRRSMARAACARTRSPIWTARQSSATQAGNVNTGAFDPVGEICEAVRADDVRVHVDGAFGLWARAAPEFAALARGVERADSWAADAHKWLNVPYDSGLAIVRDAGALRGAMSVAGGLSPRPGKPGAVRIHAGDQPAHARRRGLGGSGVARPRRPLRRWSRATAARRDALRPGCGTPASRSSTTWC